VTAVKFMVIPASFVSGHDRGGAEESSSEGKLREYQYSWATTEYAPPTDSPPPRRKKSRAWESRSALSRASPLDGAAPCFRLAFDLNPDDRARAYTRTSTPQVCAKLHIRNAEPVALTALISRRAASFFFLDESCLSNLLSQPVGGNHLPAVLPASERSTP
jgi:hypothetical protein